MYESLQSGTNSRSGAWFGLLRLLMNGAGDIDSATG